jgi:hypothetical protein
MPRSTGRSWPPFLAWETPVILSIGPSTQCLHYPSFPPIKLRARKREKQRALFLMVICGAGFTLHNSSGRRLHLPHPLARIGVMSWVRCRPNPRPASVSAASTAWVENQVPSSNRKRQVCMGPLNNPPSDTGFVSFDLDPTPNPSPRERPYVLVTSGGISPYTSEFEPSGRPPEGGDGP